MNFRWNTGRFPPQAFLISCQLAWQLSRLHGSGTALDWTCDSSWLLFFFFFSLIRGKRSWEKYALALPGFFWLLKICCFNNKDLAQPGTLVCYMGDPEQIFSLPEKLLGLSCPGSEIFLYHAELNFWAFSGDLPVPILCLPPYFLKCLIILQFLCTSNALQHCFLHWLLPGLFLAQRLHQPLWCLLGTHSW